MGGKHKQAQRTKNNARPSSSGRSAEMLGNIPPFVGFSTVKDSALVLPTFSLPGTENPESVLDVNFQLVLKKMYKKDSTTKLKALQEFAELVKSSEPEAVKAVLAFWPRLYSVLATDMEHRVREAAHVAHLEVVSKVKRNLAPFLKQLIGPWFTSQYDNYPPAATAAKQSFEAAFPPNKTYEVIVFCEEEILSYICDNLTNQTAETLSNIKVVSPEDAEAKYERVLLSSLQGYALYLTKVSHEQIKKSEELNLKIFKHQNFWKLAKFKTTVVQAAFFGVLSAVGQNAPFLYEAEKSQVASTVFTNLDRNEPTLLPKIWETALLITSNIKDWFQFINIDKVFVAKLMKVLREGGKGNAVAVFPHLLPLLSNLPPSLDVNVFYPNFFENMKTGLKQKNVTSSRSESQAIASSFVECMKYAILTNKSNIVLCEKLIRSQLISLIEWCFLDSQSCCKTVFSQVTVLAQYWSKNQNQIENYTVFSKAFWSNMESLFQGLLLDLDARNDTRALTELAGKQVDLLHSLRHTVKSKKQFKVKFTTNDDTQDADQADGDSKPSVDADQMYFDALNGFVYKICEVYVKLIDEKKNRDLIEHLRSLVSDFDSKSVFQFLLKKMGAGDQMKLLHVYDNILYKWLKCSYLRSRPVVDLIFLLFKWLNREEKLHVLETLKNIKEEECLGWCIAQTLSHPHNEDATVQEWLQSEQPSKFISEIIDKELLDESTPELNVLLKLAFSENSNGDLFISKSTVSDIISKLETCLLNPNEYSLTIDTCASLAAYISAIIYSEKLLLTYGEDLLLALFTLSCNSHVDTESLSKDTLWEVTTAWQDAIIAIAPELSKKEFIDLSKKFMKIVETEVASASANDVNAQHLADVLISFGRCCQKSVPLLTNEVLIQLLHQEFVINWKKSAEKLCIWAEYVAGRMSSPCEQIQAPVEVVEEDIAKVFAVLRIAVDVFAAPLEESFVDEDDEDEDLPEVKSDIILNVCDNVDEIVGDFLHDLAVGQSFLENYKVVRYISNIETNHIHMHEIITNLITNLDLATKQKLKDLLISKVHKNHWLWARATYLLYSKILPSSLTNIYEEFLRKKSPDASSLGTVHMTQVFGKDLTYDNIDTSRIDVENIITLRSLLPHTENIDVQIAENFTRIVNIRNENTKVFLHDSSAASWEVMQKIVEVIRCCSALIHHTPESLSRQHWDSAIILLFSWSENVLKNKSRFDDMECLVVLLAMAEFFTTIATYVSKLRQENPSHSLINEWDDLFAQGVNLDMFHAWYILSEKYAAGKELKIEHLPILKEFGKVINALDHTHLFKNVEGTPKWSKFLKLCCTLLTHKTSTLQLWSYKMLLVLCPGLVELDTEAVKSNKPHEKGFILEHFKDVLMQTQDITHTMLLEFKLGEDSCRVQPFTDSFTYTLAYLLLWDVMLNLCEKASTELRYQYAEWLQQEDVLKNLLKNIFRLMPAEVLHCSENKTKLFTDLFVTKPFLNISDASTSESLEHLVCWVYGSAVSQLPALIRQWWSNTDTRISQVVDRVTSAYVSPQLCNQELMDVAQHETKFKNMVVKVHPSVREVVAVYTVDEAQMELVITLPINYPLGVPDVQCSRQIGGTSHRQWLMQLKLCILHQNGRIWDGLSLWNNNLDKKFDGVEECYICFAVLHPGTYQLPKLCCQTCRKKFHSACLYKWFSTSNKSTCPICRNWF